MQPFLPLFYFYFFLLFFFLLIFFLSLYTCYTHDVLFSRSRRGFLRVCVGGGGISVIVHLYNVDINYNIDENLNIFKTAQMHRAHREEERERAAAMVASSIIHKSSDEPPKESFRDPFMLHTEASIFYFMNLFMIKKKKKKKRMKEEAHHLKLTPPPPLCAFLRIHFDQSFIFIFFYKNCFLFFSCVCVLMQNNCSI